MTKVFIKEEICKGCSLCVSVCPKKILELSTTKINAKGYAPVECINQDECIACTMCATICPDMVITIKDNK
ncbi:MAG: 4Fe-4S binding protein [Bacilli bacterium]|nr:4Fe-4S binding protein [Bacilli bacterium]